MCADCRSRHVILTTGAALVLGIVPFASGQPILWDEASGGNGHYFEVVVLSEAINWNDARDAAAARSYLGLSGILASAPNERKDLFIRQLAASTDGAFVQQPGGYSGPWIGGYQLPGSEEPAGGFAWLDGSRWAYTNWFHGEPNNGAGDVPHEEAIQIFSQPLPQTNTIKWNDLSSGDDMYWQVRAYVVEYIPAPPAATMLSLAGVMIAVRRRR